MMIGSFLRYSSSMSSRFAAIPKSTILRRLNFVASTLVGVGVGVGVSASSMCSTAMAAEHVAMSPEEFRPFTVTEIKPLTHDTSLYRFGLEKDQTLDMPVASLLLIRAAIGSEQEDGSKSFVIRPYTPTTTPDTVGYFDLIVKSYQQGMISKHFSTLKVGDSIEMKGPVTKFVYEDKYRGKVKKVGMIAGGSGITPMLQVTRQILKDTSKDTEVSLIFANQSVDDIMMKSEIDKLEKENDNFHVHYTVDRLTSGIKGSEYKGSVGYVTEDMIKKHIPQPESVNDESVMVFVCGPPGMMNHISGGKAPDKSQGELSGLLKKMNYTEGQVYKF